MCGCSPANVGRSTSTKPTSSAPASRHNCRNHPTSTGSEIFGGSVRRERTAAIVGCSLTGELMGFNQVEIVCENFGRTCRREQSGAGGSRRYLCRQDNGAVATSRSKRSKPLPPPVEDHLRVQCFAEPRRSNAFVHPRTPQARSRRIWSPR